MFAKFLAVHAALIFQQKVMVLHRDFLTISVEMDSNSVQFSSRTGIDGKALIFLAKEGSASQFNACGLSTVGEQMRLKELVSELPIVVTKAGQRNKPSKTSIKQLSEMNQHIYKAK